MKPVLSEQADYVADEFIGALSEIKGRAHTLTMDNRNEFAQHKKLAKALLAKVYFAPPILCLGARGRRKHQRAITTVFFQAN